MFKFKVGDEVLITTGKDKGRKGKIEKVLPKENKIVVAQINIYKRHKKVSRTRSAGIYEVVRPIDTAKVAIICPKCNKPTRVAISFEGKSKNRLCKKCQGSLK